MHRVNMSFVPKPAPGLAAIYLNGVAIAKIQRGAGYRPTGIARVINVRTGQFRSVRQQRRSRSKPDGRAVFLALKEILRRSTHRVNMIRIPKPLPGRLVAIHRGGGALSVNPNISAGKISVSVVRVPDVRLGQVVRQKRRRVRRRVGRRWRRRGRRRHADRWRIRRAGTVGHSRPAARPATERSQVILLRRRRRPGRRRRR